MNHTTILKILQPFAFLPRARHNEGMKKWFFIFLFLIAGMFLAGPARAALNIHVSANKLSQADTLRVQIDSSVKISGRLGSVPLRFYKSEDGLSQIALVGIPVNKLSGKYVLVITESGKQVYRKIITVAKRKFPVTVLTLTPKLKQEGYTAKKIVSTVENQENATLKKVLQNISDAPYSTKPFISPLAEMTIVGSYGDIRKSGALKIQHLGVDLKAPLGTAVMAVNDGKVVFEATMPDYGNTLVIDHGLGVYSLYLHLSEFKVAVGDMATQGQIVALSGDTGYVTGPHLHFSLKIRGASVDPLKFIEASK